MIEASICWKRGCKYYLGIKQDNEKEATERHYCKAFPDEIPDEITFGNNLHTEPMLGQENNIVYEKEGVKEENV